jgi:hypothetical protein
MNINKKLETHSPLIEKIIILSIFLAVLLNFIIPVDTAGIFPIVLIILQLALILLYILQLHVKWYGLLWLGFILGILSVFSYAYFAPFVFYFLNTISFVVFGFIVLIRTVRESLKHKSFELLNFIMGFLLIMQATLPFFKDDNVRTFYAFALSFAIGTIIYNDNLWHRYTTDEKNIIKYILIVALIVVLQSSFKYLNI